VGHRRRSTPGGSPLALWWLDPGTVHGLSIAFIAAIYVGFAVADGRPVVIAVESAVALGFVVVAAAGVAGSPWLLVIGYAGHGIKDLWQHRHDFVRGTRWWPPFCAAVDSSSPPSSRRDRARAIG
jgi:hypothetical protein